MKTIQMCAEHLYDTCFMCYKYDGINPLNFRLLGRKRLTTGSCQRFHQKINFRTWELRTSNLTSRVSYRHIRQTAIARIFNPLKPTSCSPWLNLPLRNSTSCTKKAFTRVLCGSQNKQRYSTNILLYNRGRQCTLGHANCIFEYLSGWSNF